MQNNESQPLKNYIIQYSHDRNLWFGYGADATRPPTSFSKDEVDSKYADVLRKWRKPYPATYVRIFNTMEGRVIQENELDPC